MTIHSSVGGHPRGVSVSSYSSTGSGLDPMTAYFLEPTFSGGSHSRSNSFRETNVRSSPDSPVGLTPPTCTSVVRGGSFREPGELRQRATRIKRNSRSETGESRRSGPKSSPDLLSISYEDVRDNKQKQDTSLRRVRSFKTTSKGVVNRGDSFRRKGARCGGLGKESPPTGQTPRVSPLLPPVPRKIEVQNIEMQTNSAYYKVVALGAPGVGKTAITQQFLTSEHIAFDASMDQGDQENTVSVLLNGVESTVEFVDGVDMQCDLEEIRADAYLVIFSIAHRDTFESAVELLSELRMDMGTDRTTILVGNKSDLVRKRKVKTEEALQIAHQYDAKYTETSAALNHNVDELLVGMIDQIRYKLDPSLPEPVLKLSNHKPTTSRIPSFRGPISFLSRLFKRGNKKSKF